MKKLIIAVKDTKADAFMYPMYFNTEFEAQRAFSDAVNAKENGSAIVAHPEDFVLFKLGTFDMSNGHIEVFEPISLGVGIDFKNKD